MSKKRFVFLIGLFAAARFAIATPAGAQVHPASHEQAEAILKQMTLEEKVGEMTQLTLEAVSKTKGTATTRHELDPAKLENAVVKYHVGSILNVWDAAFTLDHWREVITRIQDVATKKTRLKIPVLYGIDAVHGQHYLTSGTIFPESLGMAATWDPSLARRCAEVTARETRACGIPWNFAPVLDIGRQPLWSRFFETYGEDVTLARAFGSAAVTGLQGVERGARPDRVAACAKHFLGYSLPNSGKDRTPAWIPERELREYVLPPFQDAIKAGVQTVMINSGEINGIPVHASKEILTGLLRKELGFQGVAVSDWEDINKLYTIHKVAASEKDAVRMAIDAGIDMSMTPYTLSFHDHLVALVKEGSIPESRIDESVRRILRLKVDLGLFEHPYPSEALGAAVGNDEAHRLSREAAAGSITLAKNDGALLPLKKSAKILVTGPGATSLPMLHGAWTYTWQGRDEAVYPKTTKNVLQALRAEFGDDHVVHKSGADRAEAAAAAKEADFAVVVLGEEPSAEKPGDIDDLSLPKDQLELAAAVADSGTPTILVLLENRPRLIATIADKMKAIVLAYEPAMFGGEALADILSGDVNPSGRLPFTYPRFSGVVVPYDHKSAELLDTNNGQNAFNPLFAFGSGLSYTTFKYDGLTVGQKVVSAPGLISVTVHVTNSGDRDGKEVVQLYVSDLVASITPHVKRLRSFVKIDLKAGESKTVGFNLNTDELAFIGKDNKPVVEPGEFRLRVGGLEAPFFIK